MKFFNCHHNNAGQSGEDCAVVAGDGEWADLACNHPTRWAICEIENPGKCL